MDPCARGGALRTDAGRRGVETSAGESFAGRTSIRNHSSHVVQQTEEAPSPPEHVARFPPEHSAAQADLPRQRSLHRGLVPTESLYLTGRTIQNRYSGSG